MGVDPEMGLTVAISTCGPLLEVALRSHAEAVCSTVRLAGISRRSTLLLAALDLLVEDAGTEPAAIDRVVVSRGPGSFTGIRSGLATASGLAEATGAECLAFDSLTMQAARCSHTGVVWAAQPGRRGEVYVRGFQVAPGHPPSAMDEVEIVPVDQLSQRTPVIAPDGLELGGADRVHPSRGAAEALLALVDLGMTGDGLEPLYVEGPPVHGGDGRG